MTAAPLSASRATLAFILVTAVLDVMAMGIVIPVLPSLIEEFAGSVSRAGWINGVFVALWAGMQFLASPVIGALSDQVGRRPVILVSTAGLAADYVLMALAPSLAWLAVGRLLAGATSASFTTIAAYMADITPPEARARAYGLIGAAFSAGFVAGPLMGGLLGEISPRAPFWAAAGLAGLAFIYGAVILPESLPLSARMRFSWRRANPLGALRLLLSHPELTGLAIVNFLIYFANHLFSVVFVLYSAHRFGWGAAQIGLLLALYGALAIAVQGVLVGPVVKVFGERQTMVIGLAGGALGLLAMGTAPTGLIFAAALVPTAMWELAMPTIQSLMTQRVSEREQGQLQGALTSIGSVAGVVSPLFFGAIYAWTLAEATPLPYPGLAFVIDAGVLAGAAILGWRVARNHLRH